MPLYGKQRRRGDAVQLVPTVRRSFFVRATWRPGADDDDGRWRTWELETHAMACKEIPLGRLHRREWDLLFCRSFSSSSWPGYLNAKQAKAARNSRMSNPLPFSRLTRLDPTLDPRGPAGSKGQRGGRGVCLPVRPSSRVRPLSCRSAGASADGRKTWLALGLRLGPPGLAF